MLLLPDRCLSLQPGPGLLPADQLAGQPGQRRRPAAVVVIVVIEQRVLGSVLGPGLRHPGGDLCLDQLFQPGDIVVQLPGRGTGRLRRVRPDHRPVAGDHVHADQALPRARRQRLHQQALDCLLMPGHEPGDGRVVGVQPAADHPRAHIVPAGHLDRPRRPDPLAVAVHHQRHHHPRVIRRPALPVGPVPRHEPGQVQPRHQLPQLPGQVPRRQPLPRIRRHQEELVTAAAAGEVVSHKRYFPSSQTISRFDTPAIRQTLTAQDH